MCKVLEVFDLLQRVSRFYRREGIFEVVLKDGQRLLDEDVMKDGEL